MIVTALVMGGILLVLIACFVRFYFHSRTVEWGDSETRKALLAVIITVGPFFGIRHKPPRVENSAVISPEGPDLTRPTNTGGDPPV